MEIDIQTMSISSLQKLREEIGNELAKRERKECFQKLDQFVNLIKQNQNNSLFDFVLISDDEVEMHVVDIIEVYEKNLGLSRNLLYKTE